MSWLSSLRHQIFSRPYPMLPACVFAFFVLCFALHPFSPFYTHHLADPDDYMRLDEVAAWLKGQGWYDLSAPRMSPISGQGAPTVIHWSRLVDLPIALVALLFSPSFGIDNAVFGASLIVPLIWLAVLLALLAATARLVVGPDRANIACVLLLFMPLLLFDYTPGRVDHHGIQAIIAGFGLLSLGNIILGNNGRLFAVLTALGFACGFWIGAEALPWAILFVACLGLAAAWQGEEVARDAALFGLCLPLFTAALIPAALPVAEFSSRALSWFSPSYAIFSALAGGVLIIGWALGRLISCRYLRLALYALCGAGAAAAFFALVPSALHGPFADYDTFDATTALANITEAQPLAGALHINRFMPVTLIPAFVTFARLLFLPCAAFITCLCMAKRTHNETRLLWLAQSIFLGAAIALTLFWQSRVGIFMEIFALAPLTKLLCAAWDDLRWGLWGRPLFWAELGVFMLLGPLLVILLPAAVARAPLYPDILLFPAARGEAQCPLQPIAPFLNDPAGLGAKPLTIMNTSDTGPELLFTTRHNVVAGNFDVPGNEDAFAFFNATDDAKARAAARKWNADLVLLCIEAPTLYLDKDYYAPGHVRLEAGKDGMLHLANNDAAQPLIERLIKGENPAWLKPIEIPGQSDYLLYRIQDTGK
jgi:hypothetical protein